MRARNQRRHALLFLSFTLALATASCATTQKDAPPSATTTSAASPTGAAPQAGGTAEAGGVADPPRVTDTIQTSTGELRVTPIVHGTVLLEHGGKYFYFDPWSEGKLDRLPKADFVLVTDIHQDHMDQAAIDKVKKAGTVIIGPPAVAEKLPGIVALKNGETKDLGGVSVLAIPMYNEKRGPSEGKLYHDKGRGNGYVLTFGDKKVYVSGDTECIAEMRALKDIDLAFVCMNLPFTMPPAEAAECIKAFRPKIVLPYHHRGSNLDELTKALEGEKGIEVRKRAWY
jgi:L-ascorbate metabolism protein UlaG (beta-lactamase superfamily)